MKRRTIQNFNVYIDVLHIYIKSELLSYKCNSSLVCFAYIAKSICLDFICLVMFVISRKKLKYLKNKAWFISNTKNNFNSLNSVANLTENSILIQSHRTPWSKNKYGNVNVYLPYNPLRIFKAIKLYMYLLTINRNWAKLNFDVIYDSAELVGYWDYILKKYTPETIVFANDHTFINRSLLLSAKRNKIKTVYLQHAAVTENFPPLSFDLALLEGRDSLIKYSNIDTNNNTDVKLIGMPKYDEFVSKRNFRNGIKSIGIAYNLLDEINLVEDLVEKIQNQYPNIHLIIRPHPALKEVRFNLTRVDYSYSSIEDSFEFLSRIDLLLAGNSSIHLEAVMQNVLSVSYNFTRNKYNDYYGFVKNNMSYFADNFDDVIGYVKKNESCREQVFLKAKFYNESIGTVWEDSSSKIAANHIKDLLNVCIC